MAGKYFGIFVWINDDPVTGNVLNLTNIVEPRKPIEDYKENEKMKVKCPGFGIQDAILAKISDEKGKKDLTDILTGSAFQKLVDDLKDKDASMDSSFPSKKRKHQDQTEEEVKEAKKSQAKDKRELEKIRRDINLEVSSKLLPTASKTSNLDTSKDTSYADKLDLGVSKVSNTLDTVSNKKLDHVISKLNSLAQSIESVQTQQQTLIKENQQMRVKMESLSAIAQCSKCLRAQYKLIQHSPLPPTAGQTVVRPTAVNYETVTMPSNVQETVTKSSVHETVARSLTDCFEVPAPVHDQKDHQGEVGASESSLDNGDCNSELTYMGETKYGIKVKKEELVRLRVCSKNPVKFALNAIDMLVTPDECKNNLTIYGEGKGKQALDENKRKALRSEIFSHFNTTFKTEEEKTQFWMQTLVPKMNNKIRGIRNDKYKTKDN